MRAPHAEVDDFARASAKRLGIDLDLLRRFAGLAAPYWRTPRAWLGAGTLVAVLGAVSLLEGWQSFIQRAIVDHLAARQEAPFYRTLLLLLLVSAAVQAGGGTDGSGGVRVLVIFRVALAWRRRLTDAFLSAYLRKRAYYRLGRSRVLDNPDERMTDDIDLLTKQAIRTFGDVVFACTSGIVFVPIIWSIAPALFPLFVLYAASAAVVFVVLFGSLTRYDALQLKLEGDLRFALARVRRFAEAIALHRGECAERRHIGGRFAAVCDNTRTVIGRTLRLDTAMALYQGGVTIAPMALVAPRYFAHQLDAGAVMQIGAASLAVMRALSFIVLHFGELSGFAAQVNRLSDLQAELAREEEPSTIAVTSQATLRLHGVTVRTPDRGEALIRDLTLEVPPGTSLLVTGENGSGKTSLLRAVVGLWPHSGTIERPSDTRVMLLPQQPYFIGGSLREELCYPRPAAAYGAVEVVRAAQRAGLAPLADRCGGLDVPCDAAGRFSLGEQQRVAFARVLLAQPALVLLDEATSALDQAEEAALYAALRARVPTVVSVGHRPSLLPFHDVVLLLTRSAPWRVRLEASSRDRT